ncbi:MULTISPECIES: carboxyl transferase domain-containing protein [unclassified Streptomyces]|uniref:carboxyl transferase domain-containing protein n=1 Tax=unclassified Streptomyces TaxID=2593676 RepID=UPI001F043946|nr:MULTISPECIES: carboxyl transferase domain-containing protein [unclassified Streptomyces]MCH0565210.1 acetyl-CoA carboxylase [Streptomyces sp. MUM 2J]MCH0568293.1 acetyl-CoA carboxylase [Streptomyces sp. MUM 136J]
MAERLSARRALALVTDDFTELQAPARPFVPGGPLGWQGYDETRARAGERTGEEESVVCGTGTVEGTRVVLVSFEFGFLGGSLGERTGDRLEAAYAHARSHRLPVVALIATGGSRMQEGMLALAQLQRVARQSVLTREAGLPQIAVVRDPTTGGGWATLGAGADVILALPGAQVGFAGSRVRPPDADPAAYTAEAQVEAGAADAVVPAGELRAVLGRWLRLLGRPSQEPAPVPVPLGTRELPDTGWDAVRRARDRHRPRAEAYLGAYFTDRVEISGDRCGGRDPDGMRCGFGEHAGRTVAFAAQTGRATRPAGYRTAARLIRLADRLGVPVLTLVDTPGAANDADAERQGAGAAIADLFGAVAAARTPVTTLLIGEGGSGGALALAAPGRTWATPDSYFSVIAPEMAAAILKRTPEEVAATANQLRVRPQDLIELGVIRTGDHLFPGTGDRRS